MAQGGTSSTGGRRGGRDWRELAISIGSTIGIYGLGLITGPIVFRGLGADGRGELQAVLIAHQLLVFVLGLGLPEASAYYSNRFRPGALLGSSARVTAVVAVPALIAAWFLAPVWLGGYSSATVITTRVAVVLVPMGLLHLHLTEILRGRTAAGRFQLHRGLPTIARAVLIIGIWALGWLDLTTALLATIGGLAIGYGASIRELAVTDLRVRRPLAHDTATSRLLVSYGMRRWAAILSNTILVRFDQFVIVPLLDETNFGLYVVAVTVAGILRPMAIGVGQAVLPQVRRSADAPLAVFTRSLGVTLGLLGTGAIGLALTAGFLVPLVYGEEARPALTALLILLPGEVFAGLATVLGSFLSAHGMPGRPSAAKGWAAAGTVAALPMAVSSYGIEGAALVTSASYAVEFVLLTIFARPLVRRLWNEEAAGSESVS